MFECRTDNIDWRYDGGKAYAPIRFIAAPANGAGSKGIDRDVSSTKLRKKLVAGEELSKEEILSPEAVVAAWKLYLGPHEAKGPD